MIEQSNSNDRFIFTILLSILIHVVVLLGVGFGFDFSSPPPQKTFNNIEVTLVKQKTDLAPKKADFLAQANNEGGGELEKISPEPVPEVSTVPKTVKPVSESIPVPNVVVATPSERKPEIILTQKKEVIPGKEKLKKEVAKSILPTPTEAEASKASPTKAITQNKATRIIQQVKEQADKRQLNTSTPVEKVKLSARNLKLPNQEEIALIERQLSSSAEAFSNRPKKRRISAATKQYAAAAYMNSWEKKIEFIGNFNYPQEAKRLNLSGSLMLSVDINPDGSVSVDGITVSRSSGSRVLDNAAVKIVRLGAPYAKISKEVLQGNDMLTIIRTWKFESSHGLSTQ